MNGVLPGRDITPMNTAFYKNPSVWWGQASTAFWVAIGPFNWAKAVSCWEFSIRAKNNFSHKLNLVIFRCYPKEHGGKGWSIWMFKPSSFCDSFFLHQIQSLFFLCHFGPSLPFIKFLWWYSASHNSIFPSSQFPGTKGYWSSLGDGSFWDLECCFHG